LICSGRSLACAFLTSRAAMGESPESWPGAAAMSPESTCRGTLITKAVEAEQHDHLNIWYIHADIAQPEALAAASFDAATCHFGLSDIDELEPAIAAVHH
jgi:hypothetical protein